MKHQYGIDIDELSSWGCAKPKSMTAYTPHLLKGSHSAFSSIALAQLSCPFISKTVTDLSLSYGGDNLIALADLTAKMQEYNIGLMGATTSVYANRMEGFVGSVKNYQGALMEFRDATTSNSAYKMAAKQKANIAYQKMHTQFGHELKVVKS